MLRLGIKSPFAGCREIKLDSSQAVALSNGRSSLPISNHLGLLVPMPHSNVSDRNSAVSGWGVQLAFWLLLALGFCSWTLRADESTLRDTPTVPVDAPNSESNDAQRFANGAPRMVAKAQEPDLQALDSPLTEESDWRRTRHGWERLSHVTAIEALPPNFAHRVSPLFWAVWLWLISIWILVWSS